MDAPSTTVTWNEVVPCEHCGRRLQDHMDDGKCLFEASSFKPRSMRDIAEITVMTFKMFESPKPNRPYPERTKFAQRKEHRLQMKAQRKGRA